MKFEVKVVHYSQYEAVVCLSSTVELRQDIFRWGRYKVVPTTPATFEYRWDISSSSWHELEEEIGELLNELSDRLRDAFSVPKSREIVISLDESDESDSSDLPDI